MYFCRSCRDGLDGLELRILVGSRHNGPWVDARFAERVRLERSGAGAGAARRIAEALIPASMSAAIAAGEAFLDACRAALDDSSGAGIVAEAPRQTLALDPSGYRDYMIFEDHFSFAYRAQEMPIPPVLYEIPVAYLGNLDAFIGPGDEVPWPSYTRRMDYELELGIVIGRPGTDLMPEKAAEHIFGYTILNDFSARDIQMREMASSLGPCKGKNFASAVGPLIATPDELDMSAGVRMRARVNGKTGCDASSSDGIWSAEELVAWTSRAEFLQPGWLLGSGTCSGGCGIEAGIDLSPGDEIALEIEGLGILANRLGAPSGPAWMPERRPAAS